MRMFFSGLMESLKENKITFLWVLLFFLVGIVLGSYTVYYMSDFNRVEITTYFNNFLEFLGGNSVAYTSILVDSIKSILPMVVIIVLLGYTAVRKQGCYVSLIRINASEFNFYSNNNVNQRFGYKTFSYKVKNGSI